MAEPGYGLTITSLRRLRKLLWRYERKVDKIAPAVRIPASYSDTFPHRLAKPASGESFNGATPTVSTPCDIYAGEPGSEVKVQENIPVYQGRQLQSSETISDTEWVIVGEVNSRLQLVSPRTTGGGSSGGMITVLLPGDLALTDATKSSCIVKATFSGGPAVDDSVEITNPPAAGGNYQFQAASASQYVNAVFQGGSTYLICSVQPVMVNLGSLVEWNTPDLEQDDIEVWVPFIGTITPETIFTGVPKECEEDA